MDFYIDCHSHLYADEFSSDVHQVIDEAKEAGVKAMIVVAESMCHFSRILELSEQHKGVIMPALGVHPVQASGPQGPYDRSAAPDDLGDDVLRAITEEQDRLVAIGECGLDFTPYYVRNPSDKDSQRAVLRRQVELSLALGLPLNVHSRSSGKPVVSLLAECGARNVMLHNFDAKPSTVKMAVDLGYFFSVPPSAIRSEQKRKLVELVPLEQLLLETDSPVLGPEKQGRNVPKNAVISCEFISKIKGLTMEEARRATTANALRLFPKLSTLMAGVK